MTDSKRRRPTPPSDEVTQREFVRTAGRLGLTQRQGSALLGVTPATWQAWHSGKRTPPHWAFVKLVQYERDKIDELRGRIWI